MMNNNYKPSLEELVRYLRKESDVEENDRIDAWLMADEEHRHYLLQLKAEWKHLHEPAINIDRLNRTKIWERIQERIVPVVRTISFERRRFLWLGSVAAILIFMLGLVGAYFIQGNIALKKSLEEHTIVYTAPGQKSSITLPDGSKAWLNAGTRLTYTQAFNQYDRKVELEGEAFFDVVKKENLPFVVQTSHLDVVVKGTAFDVSAYPDDTKIEVSLLRGKVAINDKEGKLVGELLPNNWIQLDKTTGKYTRVGQKDAVQYSMWKSEELDFENEPLDLVLKKLERWYGVDIDWKGLDTGRRYTFKVKTESLREILELINVITPIHYKIAGKSVVIVSKK
ncbi:FecR domain-containing protein [Sphingobacterium sp.]|uniref:FecR family protein n=1 Tax=Sphingobacterium sp. TaxID=341027 RepID=UPI0028A763E5|nr:FecR domain-containing protein [Sphingobacterium sp.]